MSKKGKWPNQPFKGLGKALKASKAAQEEQSSVRMDPSSASSRKNEKPPDTPPSPKSDNEIFLEAMADVREIDGFRRLPAEPAKAKFTLSGRGTGGAGGRGNRNPEAEMREALERKGLFGNNLPDIDEYDEWVPPGGRINLTRYLHSGKCSIQDFIDLHGFTEAEAEAALVEFLETARLKEGLSCVKVIHGRGLRSPGEPVLKLMVGRLLKGSLSKHVRAYATAPARDGGLGATYVLLKRR